MKNSNSRIAMLLFSFIIFSSFVYGFLSLSTVEVKAADYPSINFPSINVDINDGRQTSKDKKKGPIVTPEDPGIMMPFQILGALSILSLAPYLIMMMTSFIRVVIVLSFIRSALGTQQVPPTQVLMGLAMFVTFFIMAPVANKVNQEAIVPYTKGDIKSDVFLKKALDPIRDFMFKQVRQKDLLLFCKLSAMKEKPKTRDDIPTYVLIPAFMISEVKTAFEIGFAIYIPFLVVDMVVSSVLMSMGMFMLSPMTISLPFKLLLFVMVDGWGIIIESLVKSFR